MCYFYAELFRGRNPDNIAGHICRLFPDGEVPPIPEIDPEHPNRCRIVRGEISNRTRAQVRAFLKSGVGKIKFGAMPANMRQSIRDTRTFTATAAQLAPYIAIDKDPTTAPRRVEVVRDYPSMPAGTVLFKDTDGRFKRVGDPDTWFDESVIDESIFMAALPNWGGLNFQVVEF